MAVAAVVLVMAMVLSSCSGTTTLQQAIHAAFNDNIELGSWSSLIGYSGSGLSGTDSCVGKNSYVGYPDADVDSDLGTVLTSGNFRCGMISNRLIYNNDGQLLLDTRFEATGKLVNFFNLLGSTLGRRYGYNVTVSYLNFADSSNVMNSLLNGDIDAACGTFYPSDSFVLDGTNVPQLDYLSSLECLSYLRQPLVTTLSDSGFSNWDELIAAVNEAGSDGNFEVFTTGSVNGEDVQACTTTFQLHVNFPGFSCKAAEDEAFLRLNAGDCQAVWDSYPNVLPPTGQTYVRFDAPIVTSGGTLLRS